MVTDKQVEAALRQMFAGNEFLDSPHMLKLSATDRMRAALDAAEAAAWETIESAPKDGTEILASAADPMATGRNYTAVAQWAEAADWLPNSVAGWFWPYAIRPTRWRHLPQPPKETT